MFADIGGAFIAMKYIPCSAETRALSLGLGLFFFHQAFHLGRLRMKHIFSFFFGGWAIGEAIGANLTAFWVGARGFEFDWKYMIMALESNINLV